MLANKEEGLKDSLKRPSLERDFGKHLALEGVRPFEVVINSSGIMYNEASGTFLGVY